MTPPVVTLRDNRIQAARAFAKQFTPFEWKYLCSRGWFFTAIDRALETGDFLPIESRADETLVEAKLRPYVSPIWPPFYSSTNPSRGSLTGCFEAGDKEIR
jgi:hypothetical protein